MATNESAESARRAQDVDVPAHHKNDMKGTYHWGRGGEGNKVTVGETEAQERERTRSKSRGEAERRGSWMEKGKEMLGLKGKKHKDLGGSAVDSGDEDSDSMIKK